MTTSTINISLEKNDIKDSKSINQNAISQVVIGGLPLNLSKGKNSLNNY